MKITDMVSSSCVVISLLFTKVGFPIDKISESKCFEPQMNQIVNKAKEEMSRLLYITLATVDEYFSPWNAPVYSAFDGQYHFFWMSSLSSQHSKNIRFNNKTFVVVYDSTATEGTGFGVYLRGDSYELDAMDLDEINYGIALLGARIHRSDLPPASDYLYPFPRRVYKFIPKQAWVNTVVNIQDKKVDQRLEITDCLLNN